MTSLDQSLDQSPYTLPYRPQLHFSPRLGWMNDPNGLVYLDGEYHLFFQHYPSGTVWGPMHWGHAVSTDLLHWQELPIALFPDENGTIYSGSIVYDATNTSGLAEGGGLVALFSYDTQSQGLAFSQDKGRTWIKYNNNPIIPSPSSDFRDPKVFWFAPRQHWIMAIAAKDRIQLYSSPNLINWQYESDFSRPLAVGVWECPDLFPLSFNGKQYWVLLISVGDGAAAGGSGTLYFIGQFDGHTFHCEHELQWLDFGRDNYAGVTWSNTPSDQRLWLGWMSNWQYANQTPTDQWRGAMTLPRQLALIERREPESQAGKLQLQQLPISAMHDLRQAPTIVRSVSVSSRAHDSSGVVALGTMPRVAEIQLTAVLDTAQRVEIRIVTGASEHIRIMYDINDALLSIDRSASGVTSFAPSFGSLQSAPLSIVEGRLQLQIFLDWCSVECFAEQGRVVMTDLFFPIGQTPTLEIFADGGTASVEVTIYPLHSVWGT